MTTIPDHLQLTTQGPLAETLEWVDRPYVDLPVKERDLAERVRRANAALAYELGKEPKQQRHVLVAELRSRTGWPWIDTPDRDVLRSVGTFGTSLARTLERVLAWPAEHQRPELVAELRKRVAAAGSRATGLQPVPPEVPSGQQ